MSVPDTLTRSVKVANVHNCRGQEFTYLQAIEGGNLINEEVKEHKDAVLLLWVVHNKANIRLAGDISEDPVFPKLKFPTREFCSSCYDNRVVGGLVDNI